jgi:hypothetical protein
MSDINIEDFIHETRSMQDSYDRADSRDCLDDVFADAELREYLDKALTLARSYDKLLRELDFATRKVFATDTGIGKPDVASAPRGLVWRGMDAIVETGSVAGTVWETNTPSTAANIASASEGY